MSKELEKRLLDKPDKACQEAAAELKAGRERIEALEQYNQATTTVADDRVRRAIAARDKALADVERLRTVLGEIAEDAAASWICDKAIATLKETKP